MWTTVTEVGFLLFSFKEVVLSVQHKAALLPPFRLSFATLFLKLFANLLTKNTSSLLLMNVNTYGYNSQNYRNVVVSGSNLYYESF
jgi:hypothetical protein